MAPDIMERWKASA